MVCFTCYYSMYPNSKESLPNGGLYTIYEKKMKEKKKNLFVAIVIKYFRVELCSNSFHNTK
jgi:hypothetical protein